MTSQPTDKSPAKKPGGLLDQYHLLGAIIDTSWATRLDHKVARHIIDRYYPKHGNGRASLRYLERATGASRSNIIASVRRLAEQGAIALVRQGQGTRPSEFSLNFEFASSGTADNTTSSHDPSGIVDVTSGGTADDTSSASSGTADVTESYLQNPAYKAEILIDRVDPAAPTAPPLADGLAATAAGVTAVEECANTKPTFEALWRAYDHAKGKKEARAAWNDLPEDTDLAAVIESASAWQQSWAAQGKPEAPRFTLARWLKDERYDEDAPKGFIKVERGKAKSKSTGKGDLGIGANIKRFTIIDHKTDGSPFTDFWETYTFRADDGHEFSRRMHIVSATAEFSEGADFELKRALYFAAWGRGNTQGDYIGRVVGASDDKGLAFFQVDQPVAEPDTWVGDVDKFAPFGTFPCTILDSGVERNECGNFVTLMLDVSDRQTNHTFDLETERGCAFLSSICRAVGIDSIEDTDVLHGKALQCTITHRGEISYAELPTTIQEAA